MARLPAEKLTATTLARRIGVHPSSVIRWILDGRIPATRFADGPYLIDRADAEAFIAAARVVPYRPHAVPAGSGELSAEHHAAETECQAAGL